TSLERFRALYRQREEIDFELGKLRQFMYATLNMVPDGDKARLREEINSAVRKATAHSASLADSVRRVFEQNPGIGYTAAGMREMLIKAGFDFTSYTS